jgi:hypothetical protein
MNEGAGTYQLRYHFLLAQNAANQQINKIVMKTENKTRGLVAAACTLLLTSASQAVVTITFEQVGVDVVELPRRGLSKYHSELITKGEQEIRSPIIHLVQIGADGFHRVSLPRCLAAAESERAQALLQVLTAPSFQFIVAFEVMHTQQQLLPADHLQLGPLHPEEIRPIAEQAPPRATSPGPPPSKKGGHSHPPPSRRPRYTPFRAEACPITTSLDCPEEACPITIKRKMNHSITASEQRASRCIWKTAGRCKRQLTSPPMNLPEPKSSTTGQPTNEVDRCSRDAQDLLLTYLDRMGPGLAFLGTTNLDLDRLTERFQKRLLPVRLHPRITRFSRHFSHHDGEPPSTSPGGSQQAQTATS